MNVQSARRIACPRCSAPVTGEFKFCPACAYRLQPGPSQTPVAPPSASRVGSAALLLGGLGLAAGLAFFGLRLFRAEQKPTGGPTPTVRLARPLTVADVKDELVHLPAGTAYHIDPLIQVRAGAADVMRYEVTRGQWAEFVEDLAADPTKVPKFLRDMWSKPYVEYYVRAWWSLAAAHLKETTGRDVERPARFSPPINLPLDDATGVLLLVPPSWTHLTPADEIAFRMPREGPELFPENLPVSEVSWIDAVAFAQWATERLGLNLWLPTETQWRRAAHGKDPTRRWPWGDEPFIYACNNLNFREKSGPLPVDFRFSDAPGMTDEGIWGMAGNVAEWVYPEKAGGAEVPESGEVIPVIDEQVLRAKIYGGSFRSGLNDCETGSVREPQDKRDRFADVGFRLLIPRQP